MTPSSLRRPWPLASSVAEQIRNHVSDMWVIPPEGLSQWLPSLSSPLGWSAAHIDMGSLTPARVLTRSADVDADSWIGCDVINLLRFNGSMPDGLVQAHADRALRDLGADAPITYRVTMPSDVGVIATRSRGIAVIGTRLWVQVTNYVVPGASDSGLIEHTILVDARTREHLKPDVAQLTESVRSALIASICAQRPPHPDRNIACEVRTTLSAKSRRRLEEECD